MCHCSCFTEKAAEIQRGDHCFTRGPIANKRRRQHQSSGQFDSCCWSGCWGPAEDDPCATLENHPFGGLQRGPRMGEVDLLPHPPARVVEGTPAAWMKGSRLQRSEQAREGNGRQA